MNAVVGCWYTRWFLRFPFAEALLSVQGVIPGVRCGSTGVRGVAVLVCDGLYSHSSCLLHNRKDCTRLWLPSD